MENQLASEPVVSDDLNQAEPVTADLEVQETPKEQEKRTFSQEEVDAMIQKRLLKEERRVHRRVEQQLREQSQAQPREEPKRETFQTDQAYLQAQVQHLASQEAQKIVEQREREREAATRLETFEERAEKAAEKYPDFDSVARNPSLPISNSMAEYISLSDAGPDIAYHLGKNPSLAARISRMPVMAAAVELSKLERELGTPKARPSNAPEPINPVGNRGRSSNSSPSDDDDIDTWMKKERQRQKRG